MSLSSGAAALALSSMVAGGANFALFAGEVRRTVGAWFAATEIVRAAEVVCAPCPSVATAVSVYVPSDGVQTMLNALVVSVPIRIPFAKKSTFATVSFVSGAAALAFSVTVAGSANAELFAGAVRFTVGGWLPAATVTVRAAEVAWPPALSYAIAVSE